VGQQCGGVGAAAPTSTSASEHVPDVRKVCKQLLQLLCFINFIVAVSGTAFLKKWGTAKKNRRSVTPLLVCGTSAVPKKGVNVKDKLLTTKKTISVFNTAKDSPLNYADLLTFCFRAGQHRYSTVPSIRRVAKNTGLKEATVSASTSRLAELGLLNADASIISPCPHRDWFVSSEALEQRFPQESDLSWFLNWKSLVRRPGNDNPLTVPAVLTYSLIRHSVHNTWKPNGGWTHDYLAVLTGTNPKTVTAVLDKLEQLGFLMVLDGMRFRLFQLRESQLACFADKVTPSGGSSEPDEIVNDFGPGSEALERDHRERAALVEYLMPFPLADKVKRRIVERITERNDWRDTWRDLAKKCVAACM